MHLVHISSSLGRGGSAIKPREVKDGLVVVAFHFKVEYEFNFSKFNQNQFLAAQASQPSPDTNNRPAIIPGTT